MHGITFCHVTVIGIYQILLDHFDRMQGQRIGKVTVRSGNISLDCVGHSIHTSVGYQFLRHGLCQIRIDDGYIRGDLEISDRIFNSLLIVCNDRECSNLCSSSGSRRNCTEMSFSSQFRDTKYLTHIFKGNVRILIFDPHCFCCVDRRTTTHSNDPVRLECFHSCSALHYGFYGRIRLNAFVKLNFHSCFFEVLFCLIKESEAFHGTAANTDDCFLTFKCF